MTDDFSDDDLPPLPDPGDRIRLDNMPADPDPMQPGSCGTVRAVVNDPYGRKQIQVDWDPEVRRSLCLIVPPDEYTILPAADAAT